MQKPSQNFGRMFYFWHPRERVLSVNVLPVSVVFIQGPFWRDSPKSRNYSPTQMFEFSRNFVEFIRFRFESQQRLNELRLTCICHHWNCSPLNQVSSGVRLEITLISRGIPPLGGAIKGGLGNTSIFRAKTLKTNLANGGDMSKVTIND